MKASPPIAMLIAPRPAPSVIHHWHMPPVAPDSNPPPKPSPHPLSTPTNTDIQNHPEKHSHIDKHKTETRKRSRIPKPLTRTFTEADDHALIAYWEQNYTQYVTSSKLSFARRAANHLNSIFATWTPGTPPTTEKQVHNKLTYLNKRFRKVCAKYFLHGNRTISDLKEGSVALIASKQFPYFARLYSFLSPVVNVSTKTAAHSPTGPSRSKQSNDTIVTVHPRDPHPSADGAIDARHESDREESDGTQSAAGKRTRMENEGVRDASKSNGRESSVENGGDQSSAGCDERPYGREVGVRDRNANMEIMRLELHLKEKELELKKLDVVTQRANLGLKERDLQIREKELDLKRMEFEVRKAETNEKCRLARVKQQRLFVAMYLSMGMEDLAKGAMKEAAKLLAE